MQYKKIFFKLSPKIVYLQKNKQDIRESIIDHTFIIDGVHWIVDCKNSEPKAGQKMEDLVAREIETYKEQLQRYEKLMSAVESRPIKTALCLVSNGTLVGFNRVASLQTLAMQY